MVLNLKEQKLEELNVGTAGSREGVVVEALQNEREGTADKVAAVEAYTHTKDSTSDDIGQVAEA